jgi:hypothetical protein
MTTTTPQFAAAETAIKALESVDPLDIGDQIAATERTIAEQIDAAGPAAVFPSTNPTLKPAAFAEAVYNIDGLTPEGALTWAAEAHRAGGDLAAVIRSPSFMAHWGIFRRLCDAVAARRDPGTPVKMTAATRQLPIAEAEYRQFRRALFEHVRHEHAAAASEVAAIAALTARIDAVREKVAAAVQAQREREERERQDAAEQVKADALARKDRIGAWFIRNPQTSGHVFTFGESGQEQRVTGLALSQLCAESDPDSSTYKRIAMLHEGLTHDLQQKVMQDRAASTERRAVIDWLLTNRRREFVIRNGRDYSAAHILRQIEAAPFDDDSWFDSARRVMLQERTAQA